MIFLGMDHSFMSGPPILFETMIFFGQLGAEEYCEWYASWDEAVFFPTHKVLPAGNQ